MVLRSRIRACGMRRGAVYTNNYYTRLSSVITVELARGSKVYIIFGRTPLIITRDDVDNKVRQKITKQLTL